MIQTQSTRSRGHVGVSIRWCGPLLGLGAAGLMLFSAVPVAAATTVYLGRSNSFAVLAGTPNVTNTGASTILGSLGVSPGSAVTGFPPGTVSDGTIHTADGVAAGAQSDLITAYNHAAAEGPVTATEPANLSGLTLTAGVYQTSSDGALSVTGGTLTLDGGGNPNAVFIFQTASSLITGTSSVVMTGGASACNVFWQVGSSATLNGASFAGTVMALTSITVGSGVTVNGRVLARNGDVTLIDDRINASACFPAISSSTSPVPDTGASGASQFEIGLPLGLGGLALLGVGVSVATIRRRRGVSAR